MGVVVKQYKVHTVQPGGLSSISRLIGEATGIVKVGAKDNKNSAWEKETDPLASKGGANIAITIPNL